jgi:hypothetical protein
MYLVERIENSKNLHLNNLRNDKDQVLLPFTHTSNSGCESPKRKQAVNKVLYVISISQDNLRDGETTGGNEQKDFLYHHCMPC